MGEKAFHRRDSVSTDLEVRDLEVRDLEVTVLSSHGKQGVVLRPQLLFKERGAWTG